MAFVLGAPSAGVGLVANGLGAASVAGAGAVAATGQITATVVVGFALASWLGAWLVATSAAGTVAATGLVTDTVVVDFPLATALGAVSAAAGVVLVSAGAVTATGLVTDSVAVGFTKGIGFALANGLGDASVGILVAGGLGVEAVVANGLQVTATLDNFLPPLLSALSENRGLFFFSCAAGFFCCSAIEIDGLCG
jgi:hypothetical protein